MLKQLNEHQDIKYVSEDTATRIFDRLDQRHDGHLSRDEFEGLVDALRNEASRPWTSEDRPASAWRASIGELVASRKFEYVVDGLLVANAVVVALQTRPQLMGKAPRSAQATWSHEGPRGGLRRRGLSEDSGLAALPVEVPQPVRLGSYLEVVC